jgi:signal peptidase I
LSTLDDHLSGLPGHAPVGPRQAGLDSQVGEAAASIEHLPSDTLTERRTGSASALIWEVAQTVLLTIAIFIGVRMVVQNFRVEGASMDPTLRSGQFILANKAEYWRADGTPIEQLVPATRATSPLHYVFGGPTRGDIIVFVPPGQNDKDYIKRVIGLPGDEIRISQGRVSVNGEQLDEPYILHRAGYDMPATRVPADSYFVLGDNRPNSSDSHLGWFVPADRILGRAWVSYWPPDLWGMVPRVAYANVSER